VWQDVRFRRLLAVFLLNGVASAVPATLVLFYVADRLQAAALAPAFLGAYFLAAGLAVPLWVRAAGRHGLTRIWQVGMVLSVASFIWAASLSAGDQWAFALVCLASGSALGADLVAPGALLAGLVQRAGHGQAHEGRYVGWWTCASKLNLALAAGLALPLLQALGYQPGQADTGRTSALVLAYAVLPCVLKLAALALLTRHRRLLETA
jgi:Na+/melibiose symporter-like transporter